jgi:hypothetical protein
MATAQETGCPEYVKPWAKEPVTKRGKKEEIMALANRVAIEKWVQNGISLPSLLLCE